MANTGVLDSSGDLGFFIQNEELHFIKILLNSCLGVGHQRARLQKAFGKLQI